MKNINSFLLLFLFFSINTLHAQQEMGSKFNIMTYGGIGYGVVESDNEPNYNLNSNSSEFLLNYKLNQKFGVTTGIGWTNLSGNGFNSIGNFYHERSIFKIPLLATTNYNVSDKVETLTTLGFYGQNIVKDEYRFLDYSQKEIYGGWNYGIQFGFGLAFNVSENFSLGINYTGQSDLSKNKSNNNLGINDLQKIKMMNSLGFTFLIRL